MRIGVISDTHDNARNVLRIVEVLRAARVDRTEEFESAFGAALLPGAPTLIHLKLDVEVSTTRATLTSIRRAAAHDRR